MTWQRKSIDRIVHAADTDGGWGYQSGHAACAEPTAWACLALATTESHADAVRRGLDWLAREQRSDGAVAVTPLVSAPCWPTSLAALAWLKQDSLDGHSYADRSRRAVDWLLHTEGLTFKSNPVIYGHNTQLKGWPWVAGTHSWVEPTSYAVLALRAGGAGNHSRAREAVQLLLDRALPDGGWNYGNRRIFQNQLRPFPAQTGIALSALAGEPYHDAVGAAVRYLRGELERIRTPMSLGWGLMGLSAWNEHPSSADEWLAECALRLDGKPVSPVLESLLLLAWAKYCPLVSIPEFANHG